MTNKAIKIAVTGGCGYIGSHTIVDLMQNGFEVVSIDALMNSSESVLQGVEQITGIRVKNHAVDLSKDQAWRQLAELEPDIRGVIHFAALKAVGESVSEPLRYYQNNLDSLLQVLDWMANTGIRHLVFSSSCTVYGGSDQYQVDESTPFGPASSPYGRTKQMGEWIIQDVIRQLGKQAISLRYFNPAGAHESGLIGEAPTNPALNLVPVITETAIGKRDSLTVFGDDYSTRDGSCIRDYVHVMDLAHAHTLALQHLLSGKQLESFDAFNLGIGEGLSVLEMIHAFEKTTGVKLNYKIGSRRQGDLPAIYADPEKARRLLNWFAKRKVEDIMMSAWLWEQNRSRKS